MGNMLVIELMQREKENSTNVDYEQHYLLHMQRIYVVYFIININNIQKYVVPLAIINTYISNCALITCCICNVHLNLILF